MAPPATAFTFQTTFAFDVFCTWAVKVWRSLTLKVATVGASTTVTIGADVIASVIEANFSGAATGVAVTVTEGGDGIVVGAV